MDNEVFTEEYTQIDFEYVKKMHEDQGADVTFMTRDTMPKVGFVAINNDGYVAAGFLRRLEGGYGQLDTFVTNPKASAEDRNEGLNQVVEALIKEAKALELRGIYAISSDISVIKRAVATGFQLLPQCIVGLNL